MLKNSEFMSNENSRIPYVKKLSDDKLLEQCRYFINEAENIVFLTGAGISTNSGIPDFRSKNGWYSKGPEDILSRSNFFRKPKEVCEFLYRYYNLIDVAPTISHKIIAEFGNRKNVSVITQNVDMLHTKAGSKNVIELHGSFKGATCYKCKKKYDIEKVLNEDVLTDNFKVQCSCRGYIKPDIVLFGEDVYDLKKAIGTMKKADLVIIIGTGLQVNPFATLPTYCKVDTPYIIINKGATTLDDDRMSVVVNGDCDDILKKIMEKEI